MPARIVTPRHLTGLAIIASTLGGMAHAQDAVASVEGGEGGEAGAVAGVDVDTAYLVRIAIVEGHLLAAATLYEKGMVDEAVGLSYHPEAEMMEEVREGLAAKGAADFTPQMKAFSAVLESGADTAEVQASLGQFRNAAAAAMAVATPTNQQIFAVAGAVLKAAAAEYAGSIEGGAVTAPLAYHEAQAFVDVARAVLAPLLTDPALGKLATRATDALAPAADAFGMTDGQFIANDPAILLAVAARVELLSSQVR